MESMAQTTASANDWVSWASSILKRSLCAVAGRERPENWPSGQPDRRVHHRMKVRFRARISNESGWMRVRGVDMHAEGALFMASQPLAPQSVVFVHLKSYGLMGFGRVRHCTERGLWSYAIGVEFPAPMMRELPGSWQFHQVRQPDSGKAVHAV
jgi:PilZ domain